MVPLNWNLDILHFSIAEGKGYLLAGMVHPNYQIKLLLTMGVAELCLELQGFYVGSLLLCPVVKVNG